MTDTQLHRFQRSLFKHSDKLRRLLPSLTMPDDATDLQRAAYEALVANSRLINAIETTRYPNGRDLPQSKPA